MPRENEPTLRDFAGWRTMIFSPSTWGNSQSLELSALVAIGWHGFQLGCPGQSEFVELAKRRDAAKLFAISRVLRGEKRGEVCVTLALFFDADFVSC